MGNYNVDAAYTLFAGLKHRAHRALTYMARRALDPPGVDGLPPLLYFGGHTEVAAALGLVPFGTTSVSESHQEIVRRVVNELKAAGAVELVSGGHRGSAAVYRLNLVPAALAGGKPRRNSGVEDPPIQRGIPNETAGLPPAETAGPREEGGLQTREEEDNQGQGSNWSGLVDNSGEDESPHPQPTDDDYAAARDLLQAHDPDDVARRITQLTTEGIGLMAAVVQLAEELTAPPKLHVIRGGRSA